MTDSLPWQCDDKMGWCLGMDNVIWTVSLINQTNIPDIYQFVSEGDVSLKEVNFSGKKGG